MGLTWDSNWIEMTDFMHYRRKINRKAIVFKVVPGKCDCILEGDKLKGGYDHCLLLVHTDQGPGRVFAFCFPMTWKGFQEEGLWVLGELSQLVEVVAGSPLHERPLGLRQVLTVVRVSFPVKKGLQGLRTIKALPCSQPCLCWPGQWTAPV